MESPDIDSNFAAPAGELYRGIRRVTQGSDDGAAIVVALVCALADYLRMVPQDMRSGYAADVVERLNTEVRESLQ